MKVRLRRALKGKKEEDRLVCLLKLPWLIRILDDGSYNEFWSSLEEFLSFANFEILNTKNQAQHAAPLVLHFS